MWEFVKGILNSQPNKILEKLEVWSFGGGPGGRGGGRQITVMIPYKSKGDDKTEQIFWPD